MLVYVGSTSVIVGAAIAVSSGKYAASQTTKRTKLLASSSQIAIDMFSVALKLKLQICLLA